MRAAPRLRVIGSHGVGFNAIDVGCATELGIPIVNTPSANLEAVAEYTLGLMFAVSRRITEADKATRTGDFDFKYRASLSDLSGKTLGVVGFGGIGGQVAAMAKAALGMTILVATSAASPAVLRNLGYEHVGLDELLSRSDVVSLHRPLLPGAGALIGGRELGLMRPSAFLINTARGGLVDETALAHALERGAIAGAGLDVFSEEPMSASHPLMSAPNAILSPHIAGSSEEALKRTAEQIVAGLVAVLDGDPQNVVNRAVWGRRRT
jgi:D-3-phosphoglycerate dehydrogenase